uniref:Uncharacterized protein n=1 Tax=Leersia perrieri TaxID=77586 RepID=A0A0D9VZ49_9ORYZ
MDLTMANLAVDRRTRHEQRYRARGRKAANQQVKTERREPASPNLWSPARRRALPPRAARRSTPWIRTSRRRRLHQPHSTPTPNHTLPREQIALRPPPK